MLNLLMLFCNDRLGLKQVEALRTGINWHFKVMLRQMRDARWDWHALSAVAIIWSVELGQVLADRLDVEVAAVREPCFINRTQRDILRFWLLTKREPGLA